MAVGTGRWWQNPALVSKTPLVTSLLLDGGAVGQIVRMCREHTAAGQSLTSWCMVVAALVLWLNFYRVKTPGETIAIRMTAFSVAINTAIVLTILYFRYLR